MAKAKLQENGQLPIQIVGVDMELGKLAASLKAEHNLPYADCFAAALAQDRKATLVTTGKHFECVGTPVNILWVWCYRVPIRLVRLPIDFASMTDLENPHIACRIVDSVKNPIIAHANPPAWFQFPPQHLDPSWPGSSDKATIAPSILSAADFESFSSCLAARASMRTLYFTICRPASAVGARLHTEPASWKFFRRDREPARPRDPQASAAYGGTGSYPARPLLSGHSFRLQTLEQFPSVKS